MRRILHSSKFNSRLMSRGRISNALQIQKNYLSGFFRSAREYNLRQDKKVLPGPLGMTSLRFEFRAPGYQGLVSQELNRIYKRFI